MRFAISLCILLVSTLVLADHHVADLVLSMNGFKNDKGVARIAVAKTRESFDARKDEPLPFRKASAHIQNGQASIVIESLPKGEYAIKVFHDENNNSDLDVTVFGLPKESFGFSNNVSGTFGPPDFDEAKFLLNQARQEVNIQMKMPGPANN